jgi:putative hydroxymethylpyrimidine transport system substrate-binding protein
MRLLALMAFAALAASGCGSSNTGNAGSASPRLRSATVVLDFTPNPVHAGIYSALAHHYDRDDGLHLNVVVPTATTDSIKLLETGRADFAILDIHDLAIARERGEDVVGIMAVVERPLAAVIAAPPIRSPRQLEGRLVGITGVPSDTAVLHSVVAGAGADPGKLRTISIGFNAVPDLLAGRVAAATAFWNDEGITLSLRRPGFHIFKVDAYGAPSYPELVLCATRASLRRHPGLDQAVVRTLVSGYDFTLRNPRRSAADLESFVPGLDPKLVAAQLSVLLPAFRAPDGKVGELGARSLRAWAAWEARFGIVPRPPDVAAAFDSRFAAGVRSLAGS